MFVIRKIVVSAASLFLALSALLTVTGTATADPGSGTTQDNDWHSPKP